MTGRGPEAQAAWRLASWLDTALPALPPPPGSAAVDCHLRLALIAGLLPLWDSALEPDCRRLAAQWLSRLEASAGALWDGQGTLVLLCANLARNWLGELTPAFTRYVELSAAALAGADLREPALAPSRWLLHQLGAADPPGPADGPSRLADAGGLLSQAGGLLAQVLSGAGGVLDELESWTAYGTRPLAADAALLSALRAAGLWKLRSYDFVDGGRLLRLVALAGDRASFGMRAARSFLLENQHPGGHFGLFEHGLAAGGSAVSASQRISLQALFSLAAAWTLAETGPAAFSFYRHCCEVGAGEALYA